MPDDAVRNIFTVTRLTREIKSILEDQYPFIWITGEISNLSLPKSGHAYFTLKDQSAVISAVMFKNQKNALKFSLESGLHIYGLARLTLYEPRGNYQLIFEHLEPEGAGSAQLAFEQLKTKLSAKGYFDPAAKKSIPFLSERISVVTSGSGAALQDILNISSRRFPGFPLDIIPVQVQGEKAIPDICQAIESINHHNKSDLIILARGGGSIEDLSAFNSESVARAIFESRIPVITGIGHETDFTIADFVSDLRAPTPSAAAELALPDKKKLKYTIQRHVSQLKQMINARIQQEKDTVRFLAERIKTPARILYDARFKLEELERRLDQNIHIRIASNQQQVDHLTRQIIACNPSQSISNGRLRLDFLYQRLLQAMKVILDNAAAQVTAVKDQLNSLSPNGILARGFAIARLHSSQSVITESDQVALGEKVDIILEQGTLITEVKEKHGTKKNI